MYDIFHTVIHTFFIFLISQLKNNFRYTFQSKYQDLLEAVSNLREENKHLKNAIEQLYNLRGDEINKLTDSVWDFNGYISNNTDLISANQVFHLFLSNIMFV